MPKQTELLRAWNDWSGGIGTNYDDGRTNGLLMATAMLGLKGELRPAPLQRATSVEPTTASEAQYFWEERPTNGTANEAYLYAVHNTSGAPGGAVITRSRTKVDLRFATYGNEIETAQNTLSAEPFGQPAKYHGLWFLPRGDGNFIEELTTIASGGGADTWNSVRAVLTGGIDHVHMLNFRLAGVRRGQGVSILKTDGTIGTAADWGSYFQVGDKNVRPLSLGAIQDLMFVLTEEGLYSFNDKGRSGLIFNDFKSWRTPLREQTMVPWKAGLLIPMPAGLFYYTPGDLPIAIGVDKSPRPANSFSLDKFQYGRWHGLSVAGDYIYGLYQTDIGSTSAVHILYGTSIGGDPTNVIWQSLGTTTLYNATVFAGIFVSVLGYPTASGIATPALWYNRGSATQASNLLEYMFLSNGGTPYLDSYSTTASGSAYFPEIVFPTPTDLDTVVINTKDLAEGDSLQLVAYYDGQSVQNIGAPIIATGTTRSERKIGRGNVNRLILGLTWTTSEASARTVPAITRIELYGNPSP